MYVFRNSCSSFFSPLGEVDEEARLAIPVPGACGAVFRRSWEYVGPLGIIFWCLGEIVDVRIAVILVHHFSHLSGR